jgi:hypothetical protein
MLVSKDVWWNKGMSRGSQDLGVLNSGKMKGRILDSGGDWAI